VRGFLDDLVAFRSRIFLHFGRHVLGAVALADGAYGQVEKIEEEVIQLLLSREGGRSTLKSAGRPSTIREGG
jgi:hypothetical protein